MKKSKQLLSLLCALCLLLGAVFVPSAVSAETPVSTSTVHIRNLWNSGYMVNSSGTGSYASSDFGVATTFSVEYYASYVNIRCQNGSYLRAAGSGVSCEALTAGDTSFRWTIQDAGSGRVRLLSVSESGKAINIENLTGSLQLTSYYDTWESAQWILETLPSETTDTVIFRSYEGDNFLFNGCLKGPFDPMQASAATGNFRYRITDCGSYCYIQCVPVSGTAQYLYATSDGDTGYALSTATLDESSTAFRWNILNNQDGSVSLVSVAVPGKCISTATNNTAMTTVASDNYAGKWTMHSGNSLLMRFYSSGRYLAAPTTSSDNDAYFEFAESDADVSIQWQVIYSGTSVYLKNAYSGKYLKAPSASGDIQLYAADYSAASDNLFRWTVSPYESIVWLNNGNAIVYIDGTGVNPSAPRAPYAAYISTSAPYSGIFLTPSCKGFMA